MFVKDKATGKRIEIKTARFNPELHATLGEKPVFTKTEVVNPYEKYSRQYLMKLAKKYGIKVLITVKKTELIDMLTAHGKSVESAK